MKAILGIAILINVTSVGTVQAHGRHGDADDRRWVQLEAHDKVERSKIADMGFSIEFTTSDTVWGFADTKVLKTLKNANIKILSNQNPQQINALKLLDFPKGDAIYHNYKEMQEDLSGTHKLLSPMAEMTTIGKTLEGNDILALHINSDPEALKTGQSSKPGIFFVGAHHAREHLSVEVPLKIARYLAEHKTDPAIAKLLEERDIWFVPMLNVDGAEFDIASGSYKLWRKNRNKNNGGKMGVDLNRNYSFGWGTGGSSKDPGNDTYMGTAPFSEPETQAMKAFVDSHKNLNMLLSFHTFSELILYPWGGKDTPITNKKDLAVFETMAKQMSTWNGYKPEQASDLYIASGDTCDWAYGEHGIFCFTFELSPAGGFFPDPMNFYPGPGAIDSTFKANIEPALYMIEYADDPYRVIGGKNPRFLSNIGVTLEPEIIKGL